MAAGTEIRVISEEVSEFGFGAFHATIAPPLGNVGDNEECLCTLLRVGDYEMLLTGDASQDTELRLMERMSLPDLELMIVGHHGSAKSCSKALLKETCPDVAVISVGRNSYGLPSEETIRRLADAGAAIYRTDHAGTVEIRYREEKGTGDHE